MAKSKKYVIDQNDGLKAEVVGEWAEEKHERLINYINASRAVRRKFKDRSGAAFIDIFCGPGRGYIEDLDKFIDGSAVTAVKIAKEYGVPFSEVHIGDLNYELLNACRIRLEKLGAKVYTYQGEADKTVAEVAQKLNPYGLNLAFLDPYNLGSLSFSIIEKLAEFKRMDMIIHVSAQDLQRNFKRFAEQSSSSLDSFAPGWREQVLGTGTDKNMRSATLQHWLDLVRGLDMQPSQAVELVTGSRKQNLYWLMFVARHDLAHYFWKEIYNVSGQGDLFLT